MLWPTPRLTSRLVPGAGCGLGVVGVDGVIDRVSGADSHSDNGSANDTEVSDVAVSESPCMPNGLTLMRGNWCVVFSRRFEWRTMKNSQCLGCLESWGQSILCDVGSLVDCCGCSLGDAFVGARMSGGWLLGVFGEGFVGCESGWFG
jgi:hypothetical protein